jgi:selenocysteine lyase/cysteine desulfurase
MMEISRFRDDTPGCENVIHFNSAGASLMPAPVIAAIQSHILLEGQVGGYEAAELQKTEIDNFYRSAGSLLQCAPHNIAFTANASDSFSRAISSIPFQADDIILTSNEDYISNQITYLAFAKRFGIKLVRAKSLTQGGIDLEDFERCLREYHPRLVAITHVPTNSGLIQPVAEIGQLCKKHETIYLVDACQSIGQMKLDMHEICCDFMSVTSRKFLRGPRGAGFLFVSDKALALGLEPLFIDMRGADWIEKDEYKARDGAIRFEDWEFAYALLLGTKAAIDYLLPLDINQIETRVKHLASIIRSELQQLKGITICDKGKELGGLVTFHLAGSSADQIKKELAKKKINVVTSYRNFAVIDYDEKQIEWTIRVSPHYFNTETEVAQLVQAVKELV